MPAIVAVISEIVVIVIIFRFLGDNFPMTEAENLNASSLMRIKFQIRRKEKWNHEDIEIVMIRCQRNSLSVSWIYHVMGLGRRLEVFWLLNILSEFGLKRKSKVLML